MRIAAAALASWIACGDTAEPHAPPEPAPKPAQVSRPKVERVSTMSALVPKIIDAIEHGRKSDVASQLFTDAEIRSACRAKPELATSALSMRDRAGFSKKRPDHRFTYEACFNLPWEGAKYTVVSSLLGTAIRGCTVEVVAITVSIETAKGPYLLEIKDALQIGSQAGLTTLPACKLAQ
jgi:hypothetical protein